MPNGTRVGHYYTTPSGKRAWRGPTGIRPPSKASMIVAVGVGAGLALVLGGGPLLAHPWVIGVAGALVIGAVVGRSKWEQASRRRAITRRADDLQAAKAHAARKAAKARAREQREKPRRQRWAGRAQADRTSAWSKIATGAEVGSAVVPHPVAKAGLGAVAVGAKIGDKALTLHHQQQRARQLGGVIDGDLIRCPNGNTYPLEDR